MSTLKPLNDKVVVIVDEAESVRPSGIILPDSALEKPRAGKVISVGAGRILENGMRSPIDVSAGDTVVFSRYGGQEVTVDGTDYVILGEDALLAVIQP